MNSILFSNEKLFIIILSFHIFYALNFSSYFNYPYYLILSNDNIFLVHYAGIDIYDSSLNKISQIIQFPNDEEMNEEIFSKIELKYDHEHILSIINDKIYIFNNEGKFLYKSEEIINNNQTIKDYALASIEYYNDTYKYIIGYFDNNYYLNLLLYSYNITENNNTLLNIRKDYNYFYNNPNSDEKYRNFTNKELSCQYMSYYSYSGYKYQDKLACFFFWGYNVGTTLYDIQDNKILYSVISCVYSKMYAGWYFKIELLLNLKLIIKDH